MIVAIDTSARRRAVAVLASRDGELVDAARHDDCAVAPALAGALHRLVTEGIEAVVVACGPGSYTGVRSGMAAALGLAHACGVTLHCVGTLDIVASAAPADAMSVMAVGDASRGAVYFCEYRRGDNRILTACSDPRRADHAGLDVSGVDAVVCTDGRAQFRPEVAVMDPVTALSAAIPAALASPPVGFAGLAATYIDPRPYAMLAGGER